MLSRVAESLYWIGRYIERGENTARLVSVNTYLLFDLPKGISPGWAPLLAITSEEKLYTEKYKNFDERSVVRFLIGDLNNPASIVSSLSCARENARTVRDIIPREGWEQINDLYHFAKDNTAIGISTRGRYDFLKRIILDAQQITGLLAGTMIQDQGYDFLRIGRNLERADMTTRIIDVRSAGLLAEQPGVELTPFYNIQWMSVLRTLSGYQAYRRHMQIRVRRADVLKFLLQSPVFPRSFYHCLSTVEGCLRNLPRSEAALQIISDTKQLVSEADIASLKQEDLHAFIDQLELPLGDLHQRISATYFLAQPQTRI